MASTASKVPDLSLVDQGRERLAWARQEQRLLLVCLALLWVLGSTYGAIWLQRACEIPILAHNHAATSGRGQKETWHEQAQETSWHRQARSASIRPWT